MVVNLPALAINMRTFVEGENKKVEAVLVE